MSAAATTATRPPGAATGNAEQAGRRVEELLEHLSSEGGPAAGAAAEELVRVLMEFYGAGLARVVALLGRQEASGPQGGPLAGLLGDELVSSLLVLHDLHPEDTPARIARALHSVRGSHPAEVVGFDEHTGVLRVRTEGGSGCGCASTAGAGKQAIEDALACFAPEVTTVDLEPAASPGETPLLQISRPPTEAAGPGPASATAR
ncbi:hypothetical protein [Streptomyces luteolus]|uniref:NIF system FeS cluster assembly NifU C-terminal domain-containing protein n=1 Tax=Streptomyces luteolus TaxID=3043615 RepID=A0ABT6T826_9ACTN|nr:hypothetical protein [Streptomyces sp. B-S-A12]MDI3424041.1 hypothetical protein [Streptomyces sp. B-S-A12]